MRIIKFRCWDTERKAWLNDIDTYHQVENQGRWNPEVGVIFVLQQFTGLYDRNHKEIYEGDIIGIKNRGEYAVRRTIEWSDNETGFNMPGNIPSVGNPWEVIGNIYEK
jgi:hypothetical protein